MSLTNAETFSKRIQCSPRFSFSTRSIHFRHQPAHSPLPRRGVQRTLFGQFQQQLRRPPGPIKIQRRASSSGDLVLRNAKGVSNRLAEVRGAELGWLQELENAQLGKKARPN